MVPQPARRGDVQGLRAVAVLVVVVFHVGVFAPHPLLPGGFVGVDVFFVISGYVITRMLLRELDDGARLGFGRFYARRARRILPALAVLLVVVVPTAQWLGPAGGAEVTARTGAAASVSLANAYLIRSGGGGYFEESSELNSLLHTWSLSVEEQFYLVLPAALAVGWALGRRRGRAVLSVALVVAVGSVASLAASLALSRPAGATGDTLTQIAFYSPLTRAWELGAGCLLAVAAARDRILPPRAATAVSVLGLGLLAGTVALLGPGTTYPGRAALVPVAATALLLAGGERSGIGVSRALAWRPLQAIGDRSYSWYLWHWPCIVFAAALWPSAGWVAAGAAVVSLVPAELSHRLVEQPVRRRPVAGRAALGLAAVCVAVPLAVSVAVTVRPPGTAKTQEVVEARFAHHADLIDGCSASPGLGPDGAGACTYRVADGRGRAVLVGDSNAGHLTEGFVAAAHTAGLDAVVVTHPSCPYVDVTVDLGEARNEPCRTFLARTAATLATDPPAVIVVSAASDSYLRPDGPPLAGPDGSPVEGSRQQAWEDGLVSALAPLAERSTVVVVHPAPRFPGWSGRGCALLRWQVDPTSCGTTAPAGRARAHRAAAVAAEAGAVARLSADGHAVVAVEPFDLLCPTDPCRTEVDGRWLFRDPTHLSVEGSVALTDLLGQAMAVAPPSGAGAGG